MALTKVPSNLDATVATTQSASDNSTNVATTAYVTTAISNLVDGAPSTLNTLDEIAAALNDDAALNTTLTNSIATKLPLAGGTMTGNLAISAASSPKITITDTTNTVSLLMYSQDADAIIGTYTNHPFKLFSNSGLALTLDTSQNATFAGTIASGAITSSAGITAETGINLESGTLVIKNGTGDSSGLRIFQDSSDASKIYNNFNGTLQLGVGNTTALTIDSSENATFAGTITSGAITTSGNVSVGGSAYTTSADLNLLGDGLAIKNDKNGSSNNWSLIQNTSISSAANLVFTTGLGVALTLNHDKSATFGGNVGIGTSSSPSDKLEVSGTGGTRLKVTNTDTNWAGLDLQAGGNQSNYIFFRDESAERARIQVLDGNDIAISTGSSPGERMRITSDGRIGINNNGAAWVTSSDIVIINGRTVSRGYGHSAMALGRYNSGGTAGEAGVIMSFLHGGGGVGSISIDSSSTTYATTSDLRLKENIKTITDGSSKIMAMNPIMHTWKSDPEHDAISGFIAQEMLDIIPESISGGDEEDKYYNMDYGRITPVIVAGLQDALKEIEKLKERINELETKE